MSISLVDFMRNDPSFNTPQRSATLSSFRREGARKMSRLLKPGSAGNGNRVLTYCNSTEVLFYEDRYCKLTDRSLSIKGYYYPFGGRSNVPISHIRAVYYESQSSSFGSSWGFTCSGCCQNEYWPFCNCTWWALSCGRECGGSSKVNLTNVVLDTGESSLKGLSVENIDEFVSFLKKTVASDVQFVNQLLF